MDRRNLCLTGVLAAVTLPAIRSWAAPSQAHPSSDGNAHDHHHHHSGSTPSALDLVAKAASLCLTKGLLCADHCVDMLAQGQKEMADCLERVTDLMAVAEALERLALNHSALTPAMAKVAVGASIDCAKACDKHRQKMVTCQECYDACKELEKACQGLA